MVSVTAKAAWGEDDEDDGSPEARGAGPRCARSKASGEPIRKRVVSTVCPEEARMQQECIAVIPSVSRRSLFVAGMVAEKVDHQMASRTAAEQTDDAAGARLQLAEQGLAGRGYSFSCKAATTLQAIRDNIQGNIGGANETWTSHARNPCAEGTRTRLRYSFSDKWLAPVSYQVLPCIYVEPTRATAAAMRKRKTQKEEVLPVNLLSLTGQAVFKTGIHFFD
ncbi:hypothetical protein HPB52_002937 [Rhipicephalus sanguineus]|uniref:Uncharacterized protein n=1 Tax=Rhipicephalus sanguineus TaxID=34632 RepID=A0A9D4QH14_RHISA|nr:hypothetical protein HPB52_002937 [Rhipicephalus sanguineus]